mgnify:CR=1 FL=1
MSGRATDNPAHTAFAVTRWQGSAPLAAQDQLADEVAVALVFNGLSHVVMMASPTALADFALGFSLSEGIVSSPEQIYGIDIVSRTVNGELGIEVQVELATECFVRLKEKRRNLAGRTGCGLCGAESLQQAVAAPQTVPVQALPASESIERALGQLVGQQPLQALTGAVHGAALCDADGNIRLLREDVGRHNALDKLIGAMTSARLRDAGDLPVAEQSFVLISSRASYEMVNKCCSTGISTLVAVSAPTALAVNHARMAGLNLIGFARPGRHVIYSEALAPDNHPQRSLHPEQAQQSVCGLVS